MDEIISNYVTLKRDEHVKEKLAKLGTLYTETGQDWVLRVSLILTEPSRPTCLIFPEGWKIARYRSDADTIDEAVNNCVDMVIQEVVERKRVSTFECYSNPDDVDYTRWIEHRLLGGNDKLPWKEESK